MRKIIRTIAILTALSCFGYLCFYAFQSRQSSEDAGKLSEKQSDFVYVRNTENYGKETAAAPDGAEGKRELTLLRQYQPLLKKNKNFIGWIKIEGTNIDYPVMKSVNGNGEYYLDHSFDQKEDRNGTLFMDDDCDVEKPTENWIIYGHNMKSGLMFGELDNYKSRSFYEKHPVVLFDSIYETGVWDVMYAFQSHVYEQTQIAFKYYQFIDPATRAEFDSGMREMAAGSFYDTGVEARWGDRLLILSTCDYDEANGRFVVVCKLRS